MCSPVVCQLTRQQSQYIVIIETVTMARAVHLLLLASLMIPLVEAGRKPSVVVTASSSFFCKLPNIEIYDVYVIKYTSDADKIAFTPPMEWNVSGVRPIGRRNIYLPNIICEASKVPSMLKLTEMRNIISRIDNEEDIRVLCYENGFIIWHRTQSYEWVDFLEVISPNIIFKVSHFPEMRITSRLTCPNSMQITTLAYDRFPDIPTFDIVDPATAMCCSVFGKYGVILIKTIPDGSSPTPVACLHPWMQKPKGEVTQEYRVTTNNTTEETAIATFIEYTQSLCLPHLIEGWIRYTNDCVKRFRPGQLTTNITTNAVDPQRMNIAFNKIMASNITPDPQQALVKVFILAEPVYKVQLRGTRHCTTDFNTMAFQTLDAINSTNRLDAVSCFSNNTSHNKGNNDRFAGAATTLLAVITTLLIHPAN